jgi:hypothetical protein
VLQKRLPEFDDPGVCCRKTVQQFVGLRWYHQLSCRLLLRSAQQINDESVGVDSTVASQSASSTSVHVLSLSTASFNNN